jgi:hypothetical protein
VFHVTLLELTELFHGLPVVYAACVLLFSALTSQQELPFKATEPQVRLPRPPRGFHRATHPSVVLARDVSGGVRTRLHNHAYPAELG